MYELGMSREREGRECESGERDSGERGCESGEREDVRERVWEWGEMM